MRLYQQAWQTLKADGVIVLHIHNKGAILQIRRGIVKEKNIDPEKFSDRTLAMKKLFFNINQSTMTVTLRTVAKTRVASGFAALNCGLAELPANPNTIGEI